MISGSTYVATSPITARTKIALLVNMFPGSPVTKTAATIATTRSNFTTKVPKALYFHIPALTFCRLTPPFRVDDHILLLHIDLSNVMIVYNCIIRVIHVSYYHFNEFHFSTPSSFWDS